MILKNPYQLFKILSEELSVVLSSASLLAMFVSSDKELEASGFIPVLYRFSLVYCPKILPNQIKIDYFSWVLKVSSFVDLIFFLQTLHSFITFLHVNNPCGTSQAIRFLYQFDFPWCDTMFHSFFTFQIFILEALHSILCVFIWIFSVYVATETLNSFVFTFMLYVWLSKCFDSWKSLVS